MNLLFSILRAGHASGTHHKLALDALLHVGGAYCENWQRLILKHAPLYCEGAKAPDTQFKDFKNHVLHVRDGLWGGAPAKATNWYQHLLAALRDKNWSEAAWCAGVLSHYYTDPLHPFHTAQSVAENNVHRAVEWSISRSYDTLAVLGAKALPKLEIELGSGEDWLKELMIAGATKSNGQYEALLTHYDFHRGVVDPPSGLDQTAQAFIGELIQYAVLSFALVLQRAFKESAVVPPDVGLTLETVLATVKLPAKSLLKRIDDKAIRSQVEAMYDELKATGRVEHAMPEDERILKALHDKEVLAKTATLDVKDALASSKAKQARDRRPVVPQMQGAAADGAAGPSTARGPAANPLVTPPAPSVSDFPTRRPMLSSSGPAVAPLPAAPAAVVPVVMRAPTPAAVVEALPPSPDPLPEPARAEAVAAPSVAPEIVSAPLAAAAANAAASALSGLAGSSLAGRLRSMTVLPVDIDQREEPGAETFKADAPAGEVLAEMEPVVEATPAEAPLVSSVPNIPKLSLPARPVPAQAPTLGAAQIPMQSKDKPMSAVPRIAPVIVPAPVAASTAADDDRYHLTPGQDIVDAPSIGPKTAERLKAVGIATVADLFAADPGALAEALDVAHIRAKTIAEWQDQARFVCEIPGLRGTHAQLLVGAGYRDLRRIARAEPREVSTDLLRYIQTADGQRILRSGGGPDLEKIMSWVKAAERAWNAKAA